MKLNVDAMFCPQPIASSTCCNGRKQAYLIKYKLNPTLIVRFI